MMSIGQFGVSVYSPVSSDTSLHVEQQCRVIRIKQIISPACRKTFFKRIFPSNERYDAVVCCPRGSVTAALGAMQITHSNKEFSKIRHVPSDPATTPKVSRKVQSLAKNVILLKKDMIQPPSKNRKFTTLSWGKWNNIWNCTGFIRISTVMSQIVFTRCPYRLEARYVIKKIIKIFSINDNDEPLFDIRSLTKSQPREWMESIAVIDWKIIYCVASIARVNYLQWKNTGMRTEVGRGKSQQKCQWAHVTLHDWLPYSFTHQWSSRLTGENFLCFASTMSATLISVIVELIRHTAPCFVVIEPSYDSLIKGCKMSCVLIHSMKRRGIRCNS